MSTIAQAGFPAGRSAGSDQFVPAGEVLSGRSQGSSGSPSELPSNDTPITENSADLVPTIMIAVEDSRASIDTVRTAHRLFGDGARYFVVNVGEGRYSTMAWANVYPVMMPSVWYPPGWTEEGAKAVTERAEHRAADIADSAPLDEATPLGDVGDPATAIIRAAHDHAVDVVVIASHQRSWFHRLLAGSVEREAHRDADFAVMVIK